MYIEQSDEELFERFGDVIIEIPELARSIRSFERKEHERLAALPTARARRQLGLSWGFVSKPMRIAANDI
jgi:hypothetical protein